MVALILNARPYLAPSRLFIITAAGAFLREIFPTRTAVKATRRYEFFACFDLLHRKSLYLNMGEFMVNPDSRFRTDEAKQQIVRVSGSTGKMIYIPILPLLLADIVIVNNFHSATQTDT